MNDMTIQNLRVGSKVWVRRSHSKKLRLCTVVSHDRVPGGHPYIHVRDFDSSEKFSCYPWHALRPATDDEVKKRAERRPPVIGNGPGAYLAHTQRGLAS